MHIRSLTLALACGLLMGACGRGYSQGERAGIVTKFSRKGLIWKSWEGELNMGGMRRSGGDDPLVPNVFEFTVVDSRVVPDVQRALESGQPVRVGYVEWLAHGCDRDTGYEVVKVSATGEK